MVNTWLQMHLPPLPASIFFFNILVYLNISIRIFLSYSYSYHILIQIYSDIWDRLVFDTNIFSYSLVSFVIQIYSNIPSYKIVIFTTPWYILSSTYPSTPIIWSNVTRTTSSGLFCSTCWAARALVVSSSLLTRRRQPVSQQQQQQQWRQQQVNSSSPEHAYNQNSKDDNSNNNR